MLIERVHGPDLAMCGHLLLGEPMRGEVARGELVRGTGSAAVRADKADTTSARNWEMAET